MKIKETPFISLFLCLLFLSFEIYGQDKVNNENCLPKTEIAIPEAKKFIFLKRADPASAREMEKAPCKSSKENAANTLKIQNYVMNLVSNEKERVDLKINGVQFEKESLVLLKIFKKLTTAVGLLDLKPDWQKDIQKNYTINPSCKKVLCALEMIWDKELSYKLIYMITKYHFNASELAFKTSGLFKLGEIDDVITALDDIPLAFFSLGDPNSDADFRIGLYESWSSEPSHMRQYVIFHEFSHNIAVHLNHLDLDPKWMNLSGHIKLGEEWRHGSNACFVSDDSKKNPFEDFAESASAYRYTAAKFKSKCPEKYQFMKDNVFKNVEYLDSSQCIP